MCLQCLCCHHRLSFSEECLIILVRARLEQAKHQGGLCGLCDLESVRPYILQVLEDSSTRPSIQMDRNSTKGIEVRRSLDPGIFDKGSRLGLCCTQTNLELPGSYHAWTTEHSVYTSHGWRCPSCEIYKRIQSVSITNRYNTPQMIS